LERARRWALEIDAGDLEAAAVARALEFFFALQPVGCAAEMGAGGAQGVNDALVAHHPKVLILESVDDLAFFVLVRKADLDSHWRLGQYIGEQKPNRAQDHAEHRYRQRSPGNGDPAPDHGKKE